MRSFGLVAHAHHLAGGDHVRVTGLDPPLAAFRSQRAARRAVVEQQEHVVGMRRLGFGTLEGVPIQPA